MMMNLRTSFWAHVVASDDSPEWSSQYIQRQRSGTADPEKQNKKTQKNKRLT